MQNIISFGISMMDTIMVGSLGDAALSATNLGGQPYFVFMVFNFGLASGGSVLISQYWGKGNVDAVRRVFGISMRCITVVALVFTTICALFPEFILSLFSSEREVITLGASYLRVVAFSYFFNGFASCYLMSLRAVENVKLSTFVYLVSFFVNVIFNYLLIFGKFGFPQLGVEGAAWGTLIARISEFIITLSYMLFAEKKVRFRLRELFKGEPELRPDYLRHSLPVVGNELIWSLATVSQAAIIGQIGSTFVAANSIACVVQQLAMVFMFGVGNGSAVVVGKAIGEGKTEYVRDKIGKTLLLLSLGVGVLASGIILLLRNPAVLLYNVTDETRSLAVQIMGIMAIVVIPDAVSLTSITGVLRGSGDTRTAFFIDAGGSWLVAVPLGILAGFVWKLPIIWVFVCLRADIVIKAVFCIIRVLGGKYVRNVTRELIDTEPIPEMPM